MIEITSVHQTYVSVSQNLSTYKSDRGGHRWKLSFTYPPMSRENYSELWAFLVKARGRFNTFNVNLFNHEVQGSADTNLTVNENVTAGSRTLDINNLQAGTNAKAGDFVSFGNSSKVYMLTSDLSNDGDNTGTLDFEPSLQADITTGSALTFANTSIAFQVSLMDDNLITDFGTQQVYGLTINLMETLT